MKLMDLDVSDILGIKHGAQKHYRDVVGASQIMGAMNNSARRVLDNWR